MSAIEASTVRLQTMADGALRITVDVEPRHARDAFGLFGAPGTPLALAALKTAAQQAQEGPQKPAGGPLAKLAGQWCKDPAFLRWCDRQAAWAAAEFIRETCGVKSRAELDHDPVAADKFHRNIREPFAEYMKGTG